MTSRKHSLPGWSPVALAVAAVLANAPVLAQSTSSGVGGLVTDANGAPVAGAEVTITHVESGTVSRASTDASGRYTARGLRVGGPYTITITKDGTTDTEEGIYLELNQVGVVDATLGGALETLETAEVTATGATRGVFSAGNKGVGTSLSGRRLEITPNGNRSLDDIARTDPRISVTDQSSGRISVAGVNNRFNSISVDGLGQGDPFGLNANGMPYTGSPISVDTIAAYDIKTTDYDVALDAVGANINAVTKSGTNEFHGSVYYAFKDAGDMVGKVDGEKYSRFDKDATFGVTLGGPILKDRLFFFGSYEQQKVSAFGGAASDDGFANGDVTQADIDEVIRVARDVWGIEEPGTYGGSLGVDLEVKRYLGKVDWNISDQHRASLTYQRTKEDLPQPYDGGDNIVLLSTRWYNKASTTENASLQLFSDWTGSFSTEAKFSYQKFDQIAGNAIDLPTINVETGNGQVRLGEDRNRHENAINTEKWTASLFGTYYAGSHTIKGGFDYMDTKALNLYGRDLHGVYNFGSIAEFAAGDYDRYDVRRPATGFTEADTAASVGLTQFSPFIQDTWQVLPNLSLTYGLRVNIPKGDRTPPEKPGFEEAFGFPNDFKLGSDNSVIMPRVSFNYKFDTERRSQLRGGVGLFQSVPPYVWLANPFQNNGLNAVSFCAYRNDPVSGCTDDGTTQLYDFSPDPYNQPVPDNLAVSGQAKMDAIDPDFKMPTVWKFTLGFDQELPWWGLVGTAEIQFLRNKDDVFYKALNIGVPQGTMPDGRQSFWCTYGGTAKNCGSNPDYTFDSTLLTNTGKGHSRAITLALDKPLSNGWYGNLSYTWVDAEEVGSNTSAQAWSSYQFVSRLNPNEEIASTATQQIRNSVKASLGWERAFFGENKTSITAYYNGHTGLPYTWIVGGDANGDNISQDPAYIPELNDPLVTYTVSTGSGSGTVYTAATAEQIAEFQAFIDGDKYLSSHRGEIAGRNDNHLKWVNQMDLAFQQEIPGFMRGHKGIVRLDLFNVLNMIDKDWGQTDSIGGFDTRRLVSLRSSGTGVGTTTGVNADGTYTYNLMSNGSPTWQETAVYDAESASPHRVVSRWSALLTVKYQF